MYTPKFISGTKADLRPLRREDSAAMYKVASQEVVARNTAKIPHPYPPGAAEAWIEQCLKTNMAIWALDASRLNHGEYIGSISLTVSDEGVELGYILDPALWNLGYMSAAVRDLIKVNPLGVQTLISGVFQDNPASARVLTKAGFDYVGEDTLFCVARGGIVQKWCYIYSYAKANAHAMARQAKRTTDAVS